MSFNEYAQSWSYDGTDWNPVHWKYGRNESPQYDILTLPVFEEDKVFVGTQVPMSFKDAEAMKMKWAVHPDTLINPLAVREGMPGYGSVSWTEGPHEQFGITAILCEGAGAFYTKEKNLESGEVLIKSIAEYYQGF